MAGCEIDLKALNDNKSAIGTKVEVFAGALYQKWEVLGASGYLGQNALPIHVGLGAKKERTWCVAVADRRAAGRNSTRWPQRRKSLRNSIGAVVRARFCFRGTERNTNSSRT